MGWARANILFDRSPKMPEPGGPMEIVFVLVWKMRQDIEFQKSRSLIQAMLSQKGADDKTIMQAFDELRGAFFPFDHNQKKDEVKRLRDNLMREINRGPLSITPLADPVRHKVAGRLARGQQDLERRRRMEEQGKVVGIDAFSQAKNRTRGVF